MWYNPPWQFIKRLNQPCELQCSLYACFMIFGSMQLVFMVICLQSVFDNAVQDHYKEISVHSVSRNSTTVPHSRARLTLPNTTLPLSNEGVTKEANLFLQWYEKKCKEQRRNASDSLQLCPCVPHELSEYRFLIVICAGTFMTAGCCFA